MFAANMHQNVSTPKASLMLIVNAIFWPQGEGRQQAQQMQCKSSRVEATIGALPARLPACLAVFSPPLTRVAGSGTGNGDSVSGFNDA